jgi:hypothetical protein
MTIQEKTGFRDLTFSQWIRRCLPDSNTGYCVSDLDFILWNWKQKKLMFIEVKTRNSEPKRFQQIMWNNLAKWITAGMELEKEWTFLGYHLIKFENTFFNDGKCFLNGEEITEEDLIKKLSF